MIQNVASHRVCNKMLVPNNMCQCWLYWSKSMVKQTTYFIPEKQWKLLIYCLSVIRTASAVNPLLHLKHNDGYIYVLPTHTCLSGRWCTLSEDITATLHKSSLKYSLVLTCSVPLPASLKPKTRYWLIAFSRGPVMKISKVQWRKKNIRGYKHRTHKHGGWCLKMPHFFKCLICATSVNLKKVIQPLMAKCR